MSDTDPAADPRPYHHGALYQAIVDAALETLAETQSTAFSLRELARRAGVSHNAPYKHFADKRELLAAVSAVGFERLSEKMLAATGTLSHPRDRLAAVARAYVEGGVANPALYRLMFSGPDGTRYPNEERAAERMKGIVLSAIGDGALGEALPQSPDQARQLDAAILIFWSQMHGLTLLLADRLVGPADAAGALSETALQGVIDGLAHRVPPLPPGIWVGPPPTDAPAMS